MLLFIKILLRRNYYTRTDETSVIRIKEIIESIKNTENFKIAMTHKSLIHEQNKFQSYERLEFYGDDLINHYITEFIFNNFPYYSEGFLTELRKFIVKGENLAYISEQIGLYNYIKLEKGLEKQFKEGFSSSQRKNILEDIFESFVAALKLEKGEKILNEFLYLTLIDLSKIKENLKLNNRRLLPAPKKLLSLPEPKIIFKTDKVEKN